MRLVLKIIATHYSKLSGPDHLNMFKTLFKEQLIEDRFTNDKQPHRSTLHNQWNQRDSDQPRQEKWAPFLKKPEGMDAKELWAYIWLYDAVHKVAKQFNFGPPDEPIMKYYGTCAGNGFQLKVKVTDQV